MVIDPFCGSNTTREAAEGLQRHWLSFELVPEYLKGSKFRFRQALETQTLWSGVIFENHEEYLVDTQKELIDATDENIIELHEMPEANGNGVHG